MENAYIINGLIKRRATLAGDIENTREALERLVDDLTKLDAVILMFDSDYKIESIKPKLQRPAEDWSKRGEMTRVVIDILRQAKEPLTARDIAICIMEIRGHDLGDTKLLRRMAKRCSCAVRIARDKGLTEAVQGNGQFMYWKLA